MYEPFPGNYVWNLSVNLCLAMGGAIGEIERANEHIGEVATQGEDVGTEAFFSAWISMADRVIELANETQIFFDRVGATPPLDELVLPSRRKRLRQNSGLPLRRALSPICGSDDWYQ
jgi:hypothetical protein